MYFCRKFESILLNIFADQYASYISNITLTIGIDENCSCTGAFLVRLQLMLCNLSSTIMITNLR